MQENKIADVIEKENNQTIMFQSGEMTVIQMPVEYINRIMKLTRHAHNIFKLESSVPVYERLTVREHLKFYKKWNRSALNPDDLLRQYKLDSVTNIRLGKCGQEIVQRLAYIHALMAVHDKVLAVNPLHNAGIENIRLFHKMMEQMKSAGKALIVITSSTEDAFVISSNIAKLGDQGLKKVETEMSEEKDTQSSMNRIKAKSQDKTIFVDLEDIEYIESSEGKIYINISREKFVIESTLAETEKKLSGHGFYRCHRSYIVNLDKVKEIITWSKNTYSIVIENQEKTKIPLSRTKYNEIQELMVL